MVDWFSIEWVHEQTHNWKGSHFVENYRAYLAPSKKDCYSPNPNQTGIEYRQLQSYKVKHTPSITIFDLISNMLDFAEILGKI
jgi:hypothetical protein